MRTCSTGYGQQVFNLTVLIFPVHCCDHRQERRIRCSGFRDFWVGDGRNKSLRGVDSGLHGARCFSRQAAFPFLGGIYIPFVPDVFTKKSGSQVWPHPLARNKHELKLVSILRAAGITGWRRHHLARHPDFVFHRARSRSSLTVVFGTAAVGTAQAKVTRRLLAAQN